MSIWDELEVDSGSHDPRFLIMMEAVARGRLLEQVLAQRDERIKELETDLWEAKDYANRWEALAGSWMKSYDELKNKYEPLVAMGAVK